MFLHLTNYAIIKFSDKFVENDEACADGNESEAHKRSLSTLWNYLTLQGHDVSKLQK